MPRRPALPPNVSGASREGRAANYYWPAAAGLGLLSFFVSSEFIRLWFVPDHHALGAFVVERIALIRVLLACAAAACAGLAGASPRRRADLLAAVSTRLYAWADHPAAPYAALLAGLLFLCTELRVFEWEPMAEGVFTFGAVRVLRGELPCRDFFTYVPPGWFFALAGLFKLFGTTLATARVCAGIVPKLAIGAILYRVSRRLLERPASLAVAALTLLVLSPNPAAAEIHPAPLTMLLAVGTIPLLLRSLRSGRSTGFVAAGVLAALCATLRQDFGLYVLAANATGLFLAAPRKSRLRALTLYLGAWSAVVASVAAAMLAVVPFEKLRECYIDGPLAYMAGYSAHGKALFPFNGLLLRLRGELTWPQTLNYVITHDLTCLITWLGLAAGGGLLVSALARSEDFDERERASTLLLTFGAAFLGYAFKGGGRPFIGCAPPAILLAIYGLKVLRDGGGRSKGRAALRFFGTGVLLAFGAILLFFRPFSPPPGSVRLHLPVGDLLFRTEQEAADLNAAVSLAQKLAPPEKKIFVYRRSLPADSGNYTELYLFVQRDAITRYHELFPGIFTRPETQARIIAELSRPELGCILETDPGRSLQDGPGGAAALDGFIRGRFVPAGRFGRFVVLKRKEPPVAGAPGMR
jgi:hypothetical protein